MVGKTLSTHSGTLFWSTRTCTSKDLRAMTGAKTATRIRIRMMVPPTTAARLRSRRRIASCPRLSRLWVSGAPPRPIAFRSASIFASVMSCSYPLIVTNARVQVCVGEVNNQVGDHQEDRVEQDRAHDDRVVTVRNTGHEILAHPRDAENQLGNKST